MTLKPLQQNTVNGHHRPLQQKMSLMQVSCIETHT